MADFCRSVCFTQVLQRSTVCVLIPSSQCLALLTACLAAEDCKVIWRWWRLTQPKLIRSLLFGTLNSNSWEVGKGQFPSNRGIFMRIMKMLSVEIRLAAVGVYRNVPYGDRQHRLIAMQTNLASVLISAKISGHVSKPAWWALHWGERLARSGRWGPSPCFFKYRVLISTRWGFISWFHQSFDVPNSVLAFVVTSTLKQQWTTADDHTGELEGLSPASKPFVFLLYVGQ